MAIAHDVTTPNINSSNSTSEGFNHTCTGSDLTLVAIVLLFSTASNGVSAITYNGVSMGTAKTSREYNYTVNRYLTALIFTLDNPATGENAFAVAFNGTSAANAIILTSYTGANNGVGAATGGADGTDNNPTASFDTDAGTGLIVAGTLVLGGDTDPFTPGADVTERSDGATGTSTSTDIGFTTGDKVATGGTDTIEFTAAAADFWAIAAIELNAAAGGGSNIPASATDGLSMSESSTRSKIISVSVSDGLAAGSTPNRQAVFNPAGTDGLTFSEVQIATSILQALASDIASLGESSNRNLLMPASATDGIDLSETATATLQFSGVAVDGLTLSESRTAAAIFAALAADGIDFSEAASADLPGAIEAIASDGIGFSETTAAAARFISQALDGIEMSETAVANAIYQALANEGIVLSGLPTATARFIVSIADGLRLIETALAIGNFLASATDSLVTADTVAAVALKLASVADSVVMSDTANRTAVFTVTVADGVSFSESFAAVMQIMAVVSDGFALGDISVYSLVAGEVTVTWSLNQARISFTIKKPGVNIELNKPGISFTIEKSGTDFELNKPGISFTRGES